MKKGFTLAEILITLGIVGVVAALTIPNLINNASTAKIGPSLAKARNSIENANRNMLNANEAKRLTSIVDLNNDTSYRDLLSDYLNLSTIPKPGFQESYPENITDYQSEIGAEMGKTSDINFGADNISLGGTSVLSALLYLPTAVSADGMFYGLALYANGGHDVTASPHKQSVGCVAIDINGFAKPNKMGRDVFLFSLKNDGSLAPVGAQGWAEEDAVNASVNWANGTSDQCNATTFTSGLSCAGSVFENNLKVIYD